MVNNNMNIRRTGMAQRRVPSMNATPMPMPAPERSSDCSCGEMMNAIMEAHFFATDLKLYLNTHPDDKRALEMYNEACRQYLACKAAFEDNCYPLTSCSAGRKGCWDWCEGVWPPKN